MQHVKDMVLFTSTDFFRVSRAPERPRNQYWLKKQTGKPCVIGIQTEVIDMMCVLRNIFQGMPIKK